MFLLGQDGLTACFRWIPEIDLAGLDHVRLLSTIDDLPSEPDWWTKMCDKDASWVKAVYRRKFETSPACIVFFVDAIYLPLESFIRFRPITTLYLSRIVAHEVGHHLIATRGFVFAPDEKYGSDEYEEEMANRYAFEIIQRMKSKWYYRVADRVLKFFSQIHFEEGRQNWQRERYELAAACWYKAWLLNIDDKKAEDLYWEAKSRRK
jgi:hypothetical protein